jgi:hypothetical protein
MMSDIFFSYSSKDRERVQPLRDALANYGFSVFWDQEMPANIDWDAWIREQLNGARCAIVLWSAHSVASDNVRHEAFIAKRQNKMIPAMLDLFEADRFPMGLYAVQAVNLSAWGGDHEHEEWRKLLRELESKLAPAWMKVLLDRRDAELLSERTGRESAERRDRTLRQQIAKEADAHQALTADLLHARDEVERLTTSATVAEQLRVDAERRASELSAQVVALTARVAEMTTAMDALQAGLRQQPSQLAIATPSRPQAPAQPPSSQKKTPDPRSALRPNQRDAAKKMALVTIVPPELRNQLDLYIQRGKELQAARVRSENDFPHRIGACQTWRTTTGNWLRTKFRVGRIYDFDRGPMTWPNTFSARHARELEELERQISDLELLKTQPQHLKH